jgi:3-oxoacyl-[acyl-carrier-protein] synthase-3
MRKKITIPKENFLIDMEDYGNTVSSTIPIVLKKNKIDMCSEIKFFWLVLE